MEYLVDDYAGGQIVDLNESLRVAREYHVLVQWLETAAEHLGSTSVLEYPHARSFGHLPNAASSVQRGRGYQVICRAPLHVHYTRLMAFQLVDSGGRTWDDLANDPRAVQRARGQQALVVVRELDSGHWSLVVVKDVMNPGESVGFLQIRAAFELGL